MMRILPRRDERAGEKMLTRIVHSQERREGGGQRKKGWPGEEGWAGGPGPLVAQENKSYEFFLCFQFTSSTISGPSSPLEL